eukprot:576285-Amphidinium_carterae.1
MVTAMEQEAEDRVTMTEEKEDSPSPEREVPSRVAPRRDPIGPKRKAPPPPDANLPKRPAHAPCKRQEPEAEEPVRGQRANRMPPMPPLSERNLDLLRQCYDSITDHTALAHNFCFVCYYLVDWLTGLNYNSLQTPHPAVLGSALISNDTRLQDRFGCKYWTDSMRKGKGYTGRGNNRFERCTDLVGHL